MNRSLFLAACALIATPSVAMADITVCVSVSSSGPAASLGIPQANTVKLLPAKLGEHTMKYIVYDDATDPTQATRNARKCIEEERADVVIASSSAPTSAAAASVGAETQTPTISLAPAKVSPEVFHWNFWAVQEVPQMASALLAHMQANGVTKLGFIGFADAYGEDWKQTLLAMAPEYGVTIDPIESFARVDTSVTSQVLKLTAAAPDAILVGGSGTPSALPALALRERGYDKTIYQTHGSASQDYIRVGGAAVEGTILPVGPVVVASQLPDDHPSKALAVKYVEAYEAENGAGTVSSFGGFMMDAGILLEAAVAGISAQPGTAEFRAALRDNLENLKEVTAVNGVYNTSETDHYGHDARSRVLITVEDGKFQYLSE